MSFSVGILSLSGNCIDLKFEDLNIARDESFQDTFKALNCYLDGLVYRTNQHQKLIEASKFFHKPIINALSEISHPCQTLSDLYTLKNRFGNLSLNILWMGDMNNVCYSLVEASNLFEELNLFICTPEIISRNNDWHKNSNIQIFNNLSDIKLETIDCVMTDVFISMNDQNSSEK